MFWPWSFKGKHIISGRIHVYPFSKNLRKSGRKTDRQGQRGGGGYCERGGGGKGREIAYGDRTHWVIRGQVISVTDPVGGHLIGFNN